MNTQKTKPATLEEAAAIIVKKLLEEKWEVKSVKKENPENSGGGARFVAFEIKKIPGGPTTTRFVFCENENGEAFLEKVERETPSSFYDYPREKRVVEDIIHAKITPEDFAALRKKHDEISERFAAIEKEYRLMRLECYTLD